MDDETKGLCELRDLGLEFDPRDVIRDHSGTVVKLIQIVETVLPVRASS